MKIHLLDPKLSYLAGHHMDWDLRVAVELLSAGHDVTVYSHKDLSEGAYGLLSARAPLVRLFRLVPYAQPGTADPVAGDVIVFIDGSALTAEDLARLPPADLWLWPTFFPLDLYACVLARSTSPIVGCFHNEPTFMSPNGRAWARFAFLKAKRAGLRLRLGATISLLQREYVPLTADGRIELFPMIEEGVPSGSCKQQLRTIGFFGHQRGDKGTAILPELIPRLLQEGYQVVIHDSGNMIRAHEGPGLKVLGYVPSLAEEIARCDLVVSPNNPPTYRVRESGVVLEALASGVPVVVPAGTALAQRVEETGGGTMFVNVTVNEVYQAIAEAKRRFPQIAQAAFEASSPLNKAFAASVTHCFPWGFAYRPGSKPTFSTDC